MREVKEICDELLTDPGPAQIGPAQMLGLARRAQQRRTRAQVLASGGLLLIVSLAVSPALVFPQQPQVPTVSTSSTPNLPRPPRDDPVLERMLATLEAAVPPHYTIESYSTGTSRSVDPDDPYRSFNAAVSLKPSGFLTVHLFREPMNPAFREDPCRIELMRELGVGPADQCEVRTVSGQQIGVGNLKRAPDRWFAVRHNGDWTILTLQPLDVITADDMARLVLDPRIAPA